MLLQMAFFSSNFLKTNKTFNQSSGFLHKTWLINSMKLLGSLHWRPPNRNSEWRNLLKSVWSQLVGGRGRGRESKNAAAPAEPSGLERLETQEGYSHLCLFSSTSLIRGEWPWADKSKDQHFHQICEDKPCTLANRAGGGGGRWTLILETAGYYPLQMTLVCQFEHTCLKAENPPTPCF